MEEKVKVNTPPSGTKWSAVPLSHYTLYGEYCSQRNKVQRDIKFAKSDYFRRRIDESGNDSGKLWKQLGSLNQMVQTFHSNNHAGPGSKASISFPTNYRQT